jgi:hypothetical protein
VFQIATLPSAMIVGTTHQGVGPDGGFKFTKVINISRVFNFE